MKFDLTMDSGLVAAHRAMTAGPKVDFANLPAYRAEFLRLANAAQAPARHAAQVSVEDRKVPGPAGAPDVELRLYRPRDAAGPLPIFFWIHGGGHIGGAISFDDAQMTEIAALAKCLVVSVEYRLSPENPYPADVDDCYAGLLWTAAHAAEIGGHPGKIAVGGGSAGGGLAAAVVLRCRDRSGPALVHQSLTYPMLDDRNETESSREITDVGIWDRETNLKAWAAYLGPLAGRPDVPYDAAPGRATDLARLPPTFIAVGSLDLFRDEDIDYAIRLMAAGVRTELHFYPGAFHGFPRAAGLPAAQDFLAARLDALVRAFCE